MSDCFGSCVERKEGRLFLTDSEIPLSGLFEKMFLEEDTLTMISAEMKVNPAHVRDVFKHLTRFFEQSNE